MCVKSKIRFKFPPYTSFLVTEFVCWESFLEMWSGEGFFFFLFSRSLIDSPGASAAGCGWFSSLSGESGRRWRQLGWPDVTVTPVVARARYRDLCGVRHSRAQLSKHTRDTNSWKGGGRKKKERASTWITLPRKSHIDHSTSHHSLKYIWIKKSCNRPV